jgi:hypothetical protein
MSRFITIDVCCTRCQQRHTVTIQQKLLGKKYFQNSDGTYRILAGECLSCLARLFPPQPERSPSFELLAIGKEREPTEAEVQGLRRVLIDPGGLCDDYDLTAEQVARLTRKGLILFDAELTQTALTSEEAGEGEDDSRAHLPVAAIYIPKNRYYSDNEDDPEAFLTTLLAESLTD